MSMPKWIFPIMLPVMFSLLFSGCSKPRSSYEGLVLNKAHEPIPGAVVIADQLQTVTGYWEFETKTDKNGAFRLDRLYPDSDYKITIQVGDFRVVDPIIVHTAANKETHRMTKPIIVGFLRRDDGAILDINTGLAWAPNPGIMLSWTQAQNHSSKQSLLGESGWRLASKPEVAGLFDRDIRGNEQGNGMTGHIDPLFDISYCCIWTSLRKGSQQDPSAMAWLWDFSKEDLEGRWAPVTGEVAHVLSVKSFRFPEDQPNDIK